MFRVFTDYFRLPANCDRSCASCTFREDPRNTAERCTKIETTKKMLYTTMHVSCTVAKLYIWTCAGICAYTYETRFAGPCANRLFVISLSRTHTPVHTQPHTRQHTQTHTTRRIVVRQITRSPSEPQSVPEAVPCNPRARAHTKFNAATTSAATSARHRAPSDRESNAFRLAATAHPAFRRRVYAQTPRRTHTLTHTQQVCAEDFC